MSTWKMKSPKYTDTFGLKCQWHNSIQKDVAQGSPQKSPKVSTPLQKFLGKRPRDDETPGESGTERSSKFSGGKAVLWMHVLHKYDE